MFYIDEVLMLTIGIFLFIQVYINLDKLKKIPRYKLLFTSYAVVLAGWFFTVLESFLWEYVTNILEHVCYMISSFILLYWIIQISKNNKA